MIKCHKNLNELTYALKYFICFVNTSEGPPPARNHRVFALYHDLIGTEL